MRKKSIARIEEKENEELRMLHQELSDKSTTIIQLTAENEQFKTELQITRDLSAQFKELQLKLNEKENELIELQGYKKDSEKLVVVTSQLEEKDHKIRELEEMVAVIEEKDQRIRILEQELTENEEREKVKEELERKDSIQEETIPESVLPSAPIAPPAPATTTTKTQYVKENILDAIQTKTLRHVVRENQFNLI